jgi:hypothetical protein
MATPANFGLQVPPDVEAGVYSNFLGVWHSGHEFTLDFATTQPSRVGEDGTVVIPCLVVSRIKVPPTLLFDIIKTLNENMTKFEGAFGEIQSREPRSQDEPPDAAGLSGEGSS